MENKLSSSNGNGKGKEATDVKIQKKLQAGKINADGCPSNTANNTTTSGGCVNIDRNDEINSKEDSSKNRRERHATNRRVFINNHNNNMNAVGEGEERKDESNHDINIDPLQDSNMNINQEQQSFPGAVAIGGIRESLHQGNSPAGDSSSSNREEKEEEEEEEVRVLEEEEELSQLVVPHATVVNEQENQEENQIVYNATEIDNSDNDKRIKKLRLCIGMVVFIFIIIIVAVAVPLALRRDSNSVTTAPTISNIPSSLPTAAPTSIPTVIPSSSPTLSLAPTRTPVDITLVLQLDDKPEETGWSLVCNDGEVIEAVEANAEYKASINIQVKKTIPVYEVDNCTFTMIDTGNDGLTNGGYINGGLTNHGYYEIYYGTDTTNSGARLVYGDGDFTNKSSSNFIVELPYVPWQQVGSDIDGLNYGDGLGYSVSMSTLGDIVVVGAPAYLRPCSAQVYKLDLSTNEWNLIDSLNSSSSTNIRDGFGEAVSTSNDGTVIAIGAIYTNNETGSVYIYNLNKITNTIEFIQELKGDNKNDDFGASVAVSGDGSTIVVGADGDNEYVKVYHKDDSNSKDSKWSQIGNTITGISNNGDEFRDSVSISNDGNIVAVGAPDANYETGYIKIYKYDESTKSWMDYGSNNDDKFVGDRRDDQFGSAISLSLSGNIVAIGAPNNDGIDSSNDKTNCGTVKIFQLNLNTNNWEQLGNNIYGENEDDRSGRFQGVKLSDDGMVVAIGSPDNDGINGYESGSVRMFEYDLNNNEWNQISQDINGESEWAGHSGWSISLSGDGSIVAIGAPWNGDVGGNGHVRVYRRGGV